MSYIFGRGISIHAPTRGATWIRCSAHCSSDRFQSTLPRGERRLMVLRKDYVECISIHAPTRGATVMLLLQSYLLGISIHAPTRGATLSSDISTSLLEYFNPRSHEGSDCDTSKKSERSGKFQSTLPRGERRCRIACMRSIRNFNPRSHEGSDVRSIDSEPELYYFNPRSHEGSDLLPPVLHCPFRLFQSSLPRGERRSQVAVEQSGSAISILAPTRGATHINDMYQYQQ